MSDEEDDLAKRFGGGLIEAINRAEATALLIRRGYRVYRPESDYDGEDLLVRRKSGRCIAVQLKSRLRVSNSKYGGKRIWMLFPSRPISSKVRRHWYLIPHDRLYEEMHRRHGHGDGWRDNWGDRIVSADKHAFLKRWTLGTVEIST